MLGAVGPRGNAGGRGCSVRAGMDYSSADRQLEERDQAERFRVEILESFARIRRTRAPVAGGRCPKCGGPSYRTRDQACDHL
jgi:hypothetical protein